VSPEGAGLAAASRQSFVNGPARIGFGDPDGHDRQPVDYDVTIVNYRTVAGTGRRNYESPARRAQADRTRGLVIAAASDLFRERGYAGTTMRAIAERAGVSVPTLELLFGRKREVLKVAVDVARAGDDEPVPVLERVDVVAAGSTADPRVLIARVAALLADAQERSAGLVLTVFEGADSDPDLATLADDLAAQRAATAAWLVDQLLDRASLRTGCTTAEAVNTVWLLMEPALFDRMRRHRHWTRADYQHWVTTALMRLLLDAASTTTPSPPQETG
jgi:AcrR family transcriptional regulator